MTMALTRHCEQRIARRVASGRYNNPSEVVRAALRLLDAGEESPAAASFPPGSLPHLHTQTGHRAERRTARA